MDFTISITDKEKEILLLKTGYTGKMLVDGGVDEQGLPMFDEIDITEQQHLQGAFDAYFQEYIDEAIANHIDMIVKRTEKNIETNKDQLKEAIKQAGIDKAEDILRGAI